MSIDNLKRDVIVTIRNKILNNKVLLKNNKIQIKNMKK